GPPVVRRRSPVPPGKYRPARHAALPTATRPTPWLATMPLHTPEVPAAVLPPLCAADPTLWGYLAGRHFGWLRRRCAGTLRPVGLESRRKRRKAAPGPGRVGGVLDEANNAVGSGNPGAASRPGRRAFRPARPGRAPEPHLRPPHDHAPGVR